MQVNDLFKIIPPDEISNILLVFNLIPGKMNIPGERIVGKQHFPFAIDHHDSCRERIEQQPVCIIGFAEYIHVLRLYRINLL